MPQRLKTLCRHPGCRCPTRGRYCDQHAATAWRNADRGRGTANERGYDGAWSKVAALRRRLDFGLCQDCLRLDILTLSKIVDHIVPIYVRPDWRLDIGNTQVLCGDCHRRKTSVDLRKYGHRVGPLIPEQIANREQANRLEEPPRTETYGHA